MCVQSKEGKKERKKLPRENAMGGRKRWSSIMFMLAYTNKHIITIIVVVFSTLYTCGDERGAHDEC